MANLQIETAPFEDGGGEESLLGKRTYLPFKLTSTCPECGEQCERDLREDYLGYPEIGAREAVNFSHEFGSTWHEWKEYVVIGVTITESP